MEYQKGDKVNYKGRICEVESFNPITYTVSLVGVSELPHASLVTPVTVTITNGNAPCDAIEKFVNTITTSPVETRAIREDLKPSDKPVEDITTVNVPCEVKTCQESKQVEKWRETVGDPVNPNHYILDGVDSFQFQKAICKRIPGDHGLCVFNVIKYLIRYKFKNGLEDIKKAKWYLEALIKIVEEENNV